MAVEPAAAGPIADPVPAKRDAVRWAEPAYASQPALVMPSRSAFTWGSAPRAPQPPAAKGEESWVERARRGPSPENPSLSLKKRLKRAAFFDKRERDAAAGRAVPVEADAGLPQPVMQDRRVLELA